MPDPLSQLRDALAGRYDIEREIGRGGMATVFLARDVKHQRLVALKVLNPDLGAVLGGERFLSEIRVTANLQHPNLLPLFDSGEAGGQLFYVMPYVDGESLRARLEREKQLPVPEAIRIATAIASALDYAHRNGVIHRDLKPENILLHDGQPIVADFGIAFAVSNAGGARVTQTGISLGTPQYMSPEQATGDRELDGRTDVYSLGAVTYEMLSGDPPHHGSSAQAIIAKVLTEKPAPLRATRELVPRHVELAVQRALAKLAADRWGTAREFSEALQGHFAFEDAHTESRARWSRLPWATATVLAVSCAILLLRPRLTPSPAFLSPVARFAISSVGDDRARIEGSAIAPDGQTIAISARVGDSLAIWVRRLDDLAPRRVQGSEGGTTPFFSPDARWVGFVGVDGIVRKVPVEGGRPTVITKFAAPLGVAWISPDTIVTGMLALSATRGLSLLLANGSSAGALTKPGAEMHHWPIATPGGQAAIFTMISGPRDFHPAIVSLRTGKFTALDTPDVGNGIPFGYFDHDVLLRDSSGAIWSLPVDLESQRATGRATRVEAGERLRRAIDVALASNGTLLYTRTENRDAFILDAAAAHADTLPMEATRDIVIPRWSPDGQQVAAISIGSESGMFVVDRGSRIVTAITTERSDVPLAWSADGTRLSSLRAETADSVVWWFWRDGRAGPERLASAAPGWNIIECDPSPDDRHVVMELQRDRMHSIYVAPAGGMPSAARMVVENASAPRWSPDGRWIAYSAYVAGKSQIFAQRYPDGGRIQLSDEGATHPVWAHNGTSIYYESGREIERTDLAVTQSGLQVRKRVVIWSGERTSDRGDAPFTNYDVSSKGELVVVGNAPTGRAEAVVELNWAVGLRRKN